MSGHVIAEETPTHPIFPIKSYKVDGCTIFSEKELTEMLQQYTGSAKDFGSIQQALETLEFAYQSKDNISISLSLPEQELDSGTVRITVIEFRIRDVHVNGNKHYDNVNIRNSLPAVTEKSMVNFKQISRNLPLANDNPAKKVSVALKSVDDGLVDAEIKVADEKPWRLALTTDNTGNDSTGRWRTGVMAQYYNLWNSDHVLSLQYQTSPDHADKVYIYNAAYHAPIYSMGLSLDFYAGYYDVNSGIINVGDYTLGVVGKGTVGGLKVNVPFAKIGGYQHASYIGMDYRSYDDDTIISGVTINNKAIAKPVSAGYNGNYAAETPLGQLNILGSLSLHHNFAFGGNSGQDDFSAVKSGSTVEYTIGRGNANFDLTWPSGFMTRLALNGQYTSDRLIFGEQYGIGGSASVRGFGEREMSGDFGFNGNLELFSPSLKYESYDVRLAGFYDQGEVWTNGGGVGFLRGIGAGIRFVYGNIFSASLDWGNALSDGVATQKGDNHLYFKAIFSY